jgi:uncharacterized Ntn-hydrolase superfamily protein
MQIALRSAVFVLVLLASFIAPALATFSIVAVDVETGFVGSAGASCISGAIILSDVHPGVGVIHTQAYWNGQNQQYARMLMDQGYSPEAIIDSLIANDAQGNPTIRQYGIIDLVDGGRSAGYTGVNCTDYKGHILGPTYAIAGNILLGPEILEDMELAFLNTPGGLVDKLMASLQAAKVPGADTRCLGMGKSSISAFLRMALPADPVQPLYLHLNVNNTAPSEDPIDRLQDLYDQWKLTSSAPGSRDLADGTAVRLDGYVLHPSQPNPFRTATTIGFEIPRAEHTLLQVFDLEGREVATLVDRVASAGLHRIAWSGAELTGCGQAYLCRMEAGGQIRVLKLLQLGE